MWFHSWLKAYQMHAVQPRSRRRPAKPRLRPEALEDRRVLAFIAPVAYSAGADGVSDVVAADFNNDGHVDLATANYNDSTVSVLLGNTDGTFQPALTSPTGLNPVSLAFGDFNEDGILDLATANGSGNGFEGNVSLLLGNNDGAGHGTGTFQPPTSVSVGSPTSVAVGDFDGDGNLDLGVTSVYYLYWYGSYSYANVLLGTGTGSFSSPNSTWLDWGYYQSATVANINGDGADDLVVGDNSYGGVQVLLGNASGFLQQSAWLSTGAAVGDVSVDDLNGDGFADIVTGNPWNQDGVSVLIANDQGGFGAAQRYGAGLSSATVVLDDFTGDGHIDIVFGGLNIVRGFGDGTFSVAELNPSGGYAAAAADLNGDGWLDIISRSYNTVSVSFNDQTWGPVTPPVFVSVSDASITEGKRGVKYLNFTVTLSAASNAPVTVQYGTQNGSATAGSDYQALSGVLTFAVGETTQTVSIAIYGDNTAEADETFQLLLSNVTGAAVISDAVGVGTIVNDDVARGRNSGRRFR